VNGDIAIIISREPDMSNAEMPKESAVEPFAATVDMKLEVVSGSA
jgi:hypothetical protein